MLNYWNKEVTTVSGEKRIQFDYTIQYTSFENEVDDLYDNKLLVDARQEEVLPMSIYQFYYKLVSANSQSRILDYKGIWGQLHEDAGYITDKKVLRNECIYWGIKKVDSLRFFAYSPMAIFVNDTLDRNKVYSAFEIIKDEPFDLRKLAKEIVSFCNAVVVLYTVDSKITVSIFKNTLE